MNYIVCSVSTYIHYINQPAPQPRKHKMATVEKENNTGGAQKQVSIHIREDSDSELQALFDIALNKEMIVVYSVVNCLNHGTFIIW